MKGLKKIDVITKKVSVSKDILDPGSCVGNICGARVVGMMGLGQHQGEVSGGCQDVHP